ncbi:unnamed protein product [Rotaria sp. Silwood1]|nr:unnamed protein product [Rotaria sp. Silwood1]CAF1653891.1 unnamed protein product [Rotaria sp. Silwood1]CAF3788806.1 unnamed protein product [Rotaria sp. Silwood1]CAF3829606.1 unnamed protein product [Rotaria sp. Silwood1]CAF3869930.1 unnamed protein product [Rotaria sp. Silwood1]
MARSSSNFKTNSYDNDNSDVDQCGNFHLSATAIFNDLDAADNNDINNDDDEDANHLVKQDYDLDSIYARERVVDDNELDTDSDDEDHNDTEIMEIEDVISTDTLRKSPTGNKIKPTEERVLSQKLSQLSTFQQKESEIESEKKPSKKIKSDQLRETPKYLTKSNKSFEKMIYSILSTKTTTAVASSSDNLEKYRQIAVLIHRIKYIEILYSLWKVYLQSGLGQLKSNFSRNELGPHVWVKPVQSMVKVAVRSGLGKYDACLDYVKNRLAQLDKSKQECHADLQVQLNHLSHQPSMIQQALEKFIEENLLSLRKKIQHKIQLVRFEYEEEIIKHEYLKQNPNDAQIKLAEEICTANQQEQMSMYTSELLDKQLIHYNDSYNFECLPIAHVPLFDSISNANVQQQFYSQYKQIIEQTKKDMLDLYTQSATTQKMRYQNGYNEKLQKIREEQQLLPDEQKLTTKMIEIIEQRAHLIEERLKSIHYYKLEKLSVQS